MKPFCLQDALAGKPVITKDGRKITKIALFPVDNTFPVAVTFEGWNQIEFYNGEGHNISHPNTYLHMAPTEKTVWVNLYPKGSSKEAAYHEDESQADHWARGPHSSRLGGKAFPITYTE